MNCRNPSLVINIEHLPKEFDYESHINKIDNNTNNIQSNYQNNNNKYNNHNNYYNFAGLVDRLDGQIYYEEGLLPSKFECGNDIQFDNRIFGGDFTSLWEFPW